MMGSISKHETEEQLEMSQGAQETAVVTPAEDRHIVWKLDRRIIPLTALLYLSAYLDRGNAGNAKLLGGFAEVLGPNPNAFPIVLSAFYITYILFGVPGNILGKIITPNKSVALGALTWGAASTAAAGATNLAGLVVCRLFIGIGEAAFGSAVPLYYSLWYKGDEIAVRNAFYIGAGTVAGAFSGLIAFGVTHIHSHIDNFRILFLIEGLPTIVLAGLIVWLLPSTPHKSNYLTETERAQVIKRLEAKDGMTHEEKFTRNALMRGMTNPTTYANGVIYLGVNCTLASISGFLPTIIKSFGYTAARAQLFTVPPYAVAFVVTLLLSSTSDRLKSRGPFVMFSMCLSAVGFAILLGVAHNQKVRYFATFLVVSGAFSTIPLMLSWAANTAGSHSVAAVRLGMLNGIGQCFSILASFIFPAKSGPTYHLGFGLNLTFNLLAACVALGLTSYYRWENKRRDRDEAIGSAGSEEKAGAADAEEAVELHDRRRGFRYMV